MCNHFFIVKKDELIKDESCRICQSWHLITGLLVISFMIQVSRMFFFLCRTSTPTLDEWEELMAAVFCSESLQFWIEQFWWFLLLRKIYTVKYYIINMVNILFVNGVSTSAEVHAVGVHCTVKKGKRFSDLHPGMSRLTARSTPWLGIENG